jgi:hypothetical protein
LAEGIGILWPSCWALTTKLNSINRTIVFIRTTHLQEKLFLEPVV